MVSNLMVFNLMVSVRRFTLIRVINCWRTKESRRRAEEGQKKSRKKKRKRASPDERTNDDLSFPKFILSSLEPVHVTLPIPLNVQDLCS